MPESLLARRLSLGTYLGIGLYVHWSFSLAIAFVAVASLGTGWAGTAFALTQLFGVFFCVTLHEYGHAMAARQFGIGTADITLLPIGGVARLMRMPRIPWQELVVAVAGPAVNVVIASVLAVMFWAFAAPASMNALAVYATSLITGSEMDEAITITVMEIFSRPSLLGFGISMLFVNLMLVVFNMIPAFPMDGGRVFRSVLAMTMDYRRATSIASKVGVACAVLMAMAALSAESPNPIPILIAVFIGYAGLAEARQVEVMESVRGLCVGQVMIRSDQSLSMDTPLWEIARRWQQTSQPALPVVSIVGTVVGMLHVREVTDAISAGTDPNTTAGQLVDHPSDMPLETVTAEEDLEMALQHSGKKRRQIPVVDRNQRLIGLLDLDTMLARRGLPSQDASTDPPGTNFDVTS